MELKQTELEKIKQRVENCKKCTLANARSNVVFGEGDPNADIVFVGEAPGLNEDKTGKPFCGQAGKFLDDMLNSIGLDRSKIYILNTLKCRPPENRDPEESEKAVCREYLDEQIKIIDPKIIVLLGRHSLNNFMPEVGKISAVHGRAFSRADGRVYFVLYHPAAALHNGSLRDTLISDFGKIPELIKKINIKLEK